MSQPGFCVWLTGLSGAGKSTIAAELHRQLQASGHDAVVFDGDAVRSSVHRQLGYTREDRHKNIVGVAELAADLVHGSGIAICALMSPYADSRAKARCLMPAGRFLLVHVSTPLVICEQRDVKSLYARARKGEVRHIVGLDEPYETPADADLRLDTTSSRVDDDVATIIGALVDRGWLIHRTAVPRSTSAF